MAHSRIGWVNLWIVVALAALFVLPSQGIAARGVPSPAASLPTPQSTPRSGPAVTACAAPCVLATIPVGSAPEDIAYDLSNREIFVTNWNSNTVSVASTQNNTVVANITVGTNPYGLAYDSGKGEVFVANWGTYTVSVINCTSDQVVATINLPSVSYPRGVAYDSAKGEVFVTEASGNVAVISDGTNSIIATIPVGSASTIPVDDVYDSGKGEVFVVDNSNTGNGNVSVISDSTNTVVATILVGFSPWYEAYDGGKGEVLVTNKIGGTLSVIDDSTNKVTNTVVLNTEPAGVAYDRGKGEAFVANYGTNNVTILNDSKNTPVANVNVGSGPAGTAYDQADGEIFVANGNANSVSVVSDGTHGSITFTESGLPTGTNWSLVWNGTSSATKTTSLTLTEPNGTYTYSIGNVTVGGHKYLPSPSLGSITISGASLTQSITFVGPPTYSATFPESGLPAGTNWSVTLNGTTNSTTTYKITFGHLSNNSTGYTFSVHRLVGYTASPSSGQVVINGANVTTPINFTKTPQAKYLVTFTEIGLSAGTSWSVVFNGTTNTSGSSTLTFTMPNGTYPYTVAPVPGYAASPSSGTLTVSGAGGAQAVTFTTVVTSVPVGSGPIGLAYDSANGYVYVANGGGNNVTVLNGTKVVANVPCGPGPWGVVYDPQNGYVYTANWNGGSTSQTVTVINGLKDVTNITVGSQPMGITYDSKNGTIWVANDGGGGGLSVIRGTLVVWSLSNPSLASGIAYDPSHDYAYSADRSTGGGTITNASGTFLTFPTGGSTQPYWVTDIPGRGEVYVSEYGGNTLEVLNGTRITGNITSVYSPMGLAYDPVSGYAYVTQYGRASVNVIVGTVSLGNISVGSNPIDALYDPANGLVYVTNRMSNNVSIINTSAVFSTTLASVGVTPTSASLLLNGTQIFSATPVCKGGPCASGVAYSWTLTSNLGKLSASTGNPVTFTAGSTKGNLTLFVNATLSNATVQSSPVPIFISSSPTPTLSAVSVAPTSATVTVNGTRRFTATASCTSTCPPGVTYLWTLNNTLGSVSPSTGSATTFTAGPTPGATTLTVTASLNGTNRQANASITISGQTPVLSSISITPTSVAIGVGNSSSFTAHPNCNGGPCPSNVVYSWSLQNSSLGNLTASFLPTATFTAGNTAGQEILFATGDLNGVQQTGLAIINITKGAVPTLTGLALSPSPTVLVQAGRSLAFNATPSCSVNPCPSGIVYNWVLNNTLGNLSSTTGPSVVFTAGASAGAASLTVTSQLDGVSKTATSGITITSSVVPVITGVAITPNSASLNINQGRGLTANASCAPGPCPSSTTYAWSLNNSLGSINPSTGTSTQFTAGSASGSVTLKVNASFNGKIVTNSVVITISQPTPPRGNSTALPTFLGLPGYEGYILLIPIAAAVAAAILAVLLRRKKAETTPQPSADHQGYPEYPGNSQQPPYPPGQ